MNEHEIVLRNLSALVTGSLSTREESILREHVARCAECARQLGGWTSLSQAVKNLADPELTTRQLARITTLAQARRQEVLEKRHHRWVVIALAIYAWLLFLVSLPMLSALGRLIGRSYGVPPVATALVALTLWGTFCWMVGFGLVPLLQSHRMNRREKWL